MKRKCSLCGEVTEGWGEAYLHMWNSEKHQNFPDGTIITMVGIDEHGNKIPSSEDEDREFNFGAT